MADDVFTLKHIDAAIELLKKNNVPPDEDGFYKIQVHPKKAGMLAGVLVVGSMVDNTADKWQAREEELRGRCGQ